MKISSPIARRMGASLLALSALATMAAGKNWVTEIERSPASHIIGDPDAALTVTDFSSYTCSHCGTFARTGGEIMKLAYVGPGKTRVEIRHVIRNPVDLTATLATWCGDKDTFLRNHAAIMFAQEKWLPKVANATPGQRQRWSTGPIPSRLRAIASDLDFYEIFETRGIDRPALDQCLADTKLMDTLIGTTMADAETYGIRVTPSFAIDGELLDGTHSWEALQPQIQSGLDSADSDVDGSGMPAPMGESAFSLE